MNAAAISLLLLAFLTHSEANLLSYVFPMVKVTVSNDSNDTVYFMCRYTEKDGNLYELKPMELFHFEIIHAGFPMRWCYMYIDESVNGFFWAYTVKARCTECYWSIRNRRLFIYRVARQRWEQQRLFAPWSFNASDYTKELDEN